MYLVLYNFGDESLHQVSQKTLSARDI